MTDQLTEEELTYLFHPHEVACLHDEHLLVRCPLCTHLMSLHNFHCCEFCMVGTCNCTGDLYNYFEKLHEGESTEA